MCSVVWYSKPGFHSAGPTSWSILNKSGELVGSFIVVACDLLTSRNVLFSHTPDDPVNILPEARCWMGVAVVHRTPIPRGEVSRDEIRKHATLQGEWVLHPNNANLLSLLDGLLGYCSAPSNLRLANVELVL